MNPFALVISAEEVFVLFLLALLAWFIYIQVTIGRPDKLGEFKSLLRNNKGEIKLMEFALEARMSAKSAQRFLDARAKEFGGIQTVTEYGDIVYHFGDSKKQLIEG